MIFQPKLIAKALRNHQWEDLAHLAETLQAGIPADIAQTDPARFQMWMKGLTYCYLIGWNRLNANVLRSMIGNTSREYLTQTPP
jgi:hypothetical protein